jgi:hypothetical protein
MLGIDNQVSSQVQTIEISTNLQVLNSLSKRKVVMLNATKGKCMTIRRMLQGSLVWDQRNMSSKF